MARRSQRTDPSGPERDVPEHRYQEFLDEIFGVAETVDDVFDADWIVKAKPAVLAEPYIRTFRHSGRDLSRFSDKAVATGLDVLLFSHASSCVTDLSGPNVTVAQKGRIFNAVTALYSDCLRHRSPSVLGHLSETRNNPLEYVTYMLWDVSPLEQLRKQDDRIAMAFHEMLSATLELDHDGCVESALHGLGHYGGPARQTIIDSYLGRHPNARPELRAYAERAKTGMIL